MKKWKQKAIVQKAISYLPFSHKINYLFQKYVTKGIELSDEYFYDRLHHASDHLKSYQKYSDSNIPESCLEIGTGWYPVVPIAFFLSGARTIYTIDISKLTSKRRIKTTLKWFVESNDSDKLKNIINVLPERFEVALNLLSDYDKLSFNQVLQRLNITYLIQDAGHLNMADDTIDLITSNNTLQHIYSNKLPTILIELKRIVNKENGVMSHFIDMTDHFEHNDKSINIYNFLQFTDKQWKWINNSIQPQNRLRIYEFKEIYKELGIPITEESFNEGNTDELKTINLIEKYKIYSLEEIAKSHCHFISFIGNTSIINNEDN